MLILFIVVSPNGCSNGSDQTAARCQKQKKLKMCTCVFLFYFNGYVNVCSNIPYSTIRANIDVNLKWYPTNILVHVCWLRKINAFINLRALFSNFHKRKESTRLMLILFCVLPLKEIEFSKLFLEPQLFRLIFIA